MTAFSRETLPNLYRNREGDLSRSVHHCSWSMMWCVEAGKSLR
jgi:hypothetical protein